MSAEAPLGTLVLSAHTLERIALLAAEYEGGWISAEGLAQGVVYELQVHERRHTGNE